MPDYLGINVDYSRDGLFDQLGLTRLRDSYMREDETSPQHRFAYVARAFASNDAHAQRLYDYASQHWLSFSTPILSFGRTKKGLPISCFAQGTKVLTSQGFKDIKDIKVGDMVMSHDGTFNEVEATRCKESDDIYELTVNDEVFLVTGDHLILTKEDGWVRVDELDSSKHDIVQLTQNSSNLNFSVKKLEKSETVYDIQVKDKHSFTVGEQKIVVHNCFLNYIDDTAEGLSETLTETNWLSMLGGGVGTGFGIRSASDKSTGVMPHLKIYDASCLAYRQGTTRRGSYAAYLDISHPDIINFIEMRKPTGDPNLRCLNMHHGVNIPDSFMEIIENCMKDPEYDDTWELKDPVSNIVKERVSARELWQRLLEMRMQTGEPYIHFIDESNRCLPEFLKNKGLKINQSNLCSEIILPTSKKRTAVCCLSSVNVEYFDQWKDNQMFLLDVAEMLDNVLQYFINNAPSNVSRAVYSAKQERSIGVGALGFHAYLQSQMIPFESVAARIANKMMFKHIRTSLDDANLFLGKTRGEAPDAAGTGLRFSHVMAIAPNASSSIIKGNTSPSIEPFKANAYRQDTLSGSFLAKNKFLNKLIKERVGEDSQEIWSSIIANGGSVQHLDILTDDEKEVFKTAIEIDQRWIIEHASVRQEYIDQAQSVNLFFKPDVNIKYLHATHFLAWKQKLKTLYYCRSEKIAKADRVSQKIERKRIEEIDMQQLAAGESCIMCEG